MVAMMWRTGAMLLSPGEVSVVAAVEGGKQAAPQKVRHARGRAGPLQSEYPRE